MAVVSLFGSKVMLAFCNFVLLVCGFILVIGGMLVLFDAERVLLSKLLSTGPLSGMPHPLFYYVAIGLSLLGLILAAAGIIGCWASCLSNYHVLTLYFFIVMVVLVGECAVYIIAWAWPHCMGLGLDIEDVIKTLQRNYGASGHEQFTAAVDLAQTIFHCCGMESANEYDTSLWRLQALGPSLAVPLSCCVLNNFNESKAYLNPAPINVTLCQALERNRHEGYRYTSACKDPLEQWYRHHYVIFLGVGLAVVLIEFVVLLSSVLTCTRLYHHKQETKGHSKNLRQEANSSTPKDTTYQKRTSDSTAGPESTAYSNETYALTDGFRPHYKLIDRA